jgi:hypothetical protein
MRRPITTLVAMLSLAMFGVLVTSAYGDPSGSCGSDSDCAGYGRCSGVVALPSS